MSTFRVRPSKPLTETAEAVFRLIVHANPFRGRGVDLAAVSGIRKDLALNALVVLMDREFITVRGTYIRPTSVGIRYLSERGSRRGVLPYTRLRG